MFDTPQRQEQALTVTLLTRVVQELIENEFGSVRIVGEISNYKLHSSGHRYFTLKDSSAQLKCVMWRSRNPSVELYDGMRVYANGRLSVYAAQGVYQLDCTSIQAAGAGDLFVAFERLKKELDEAGYFSPTRKLRLPAMPQRIAIITSPTGAALQDMISVIERRLPTVEILLRPTIVQGDTAPADIAQALRDVHTVKPDVIIVGRGGGSLEDLWAFNTRIVADAVFLRTIPVISAVGHETDVTIADFVADVRAATPTAAAELCTPVRREDLYYTIDMITDSFHERIRELHGDAMLVVDDFLHENISRRLRSLIAVHQKSLQHDISAMTSRLGLHHSHLQQSLTSIEETVRALHPLAPLRKGFALLERDGVVLRSSDELTVNDTIQLRREYGTHAARIIE
ncbi:MAG: exodeoxyribonuclease VII large subunit [Candidatus Kapabacteria bacterium]|nr:exodeoxyribonuclease VII large subunit [Candidatus Kapabacteria bacterium]